VANTILNVMRIAAVVAYAATIVHLTIRFPEMHASKRSKPSRSYR
jgi:hypothetical protein